MPTGDRATQSPGVRDREQGLMIDCSMCYRQPVQKSKELLRGVMRFACHCAKIPGGMLIP